VTAPNRSPSSPKQSRDKAKDRRLVGQVVGGKYKVISLLGQGGFGSVFLVEMTSGIVGDRLAMKILPDELSQNDVFREQFINEIRVAMKMVDKHVVQIRDVGVLEGDESVGGGLLYYTMDYIEGQPLSQIIREEGRLTAPRTLRIVRRILPALRTAHNAGIIHRDLKPANIMVEPDGDKPDQVRVLDFGIATAIDTDSSESSEEKNEDGTKKKKGFAGSPYYMPPEQFRSREMGFYTDLYSVGVILYECITGQKPYVGATPQEIYNNIKKGPPVPINELAPEVKSFPGLAELVMKALERNPQKRFQTAKEFFEQLNAVITGRAQPDTTGAGVGVEETDTPANAGAGAGRAAGRGPARRPDPKSRDKIRRKVARESARSSRGGWLLLFVVVVGVIGVGLLFEDKVRELLGKNGSVPETANKTTVDDTSKSIAAGATHEDREKTAAERMRERRTQRNIDDNGTGVTKVENRKPSAEVITDTIKKYYREGLDALEEKKYEEVTANADEILGLRAKEHRGLVLRGAAYLAQKQHIEAHGVLLDAVQAKSKSVKLRAALYLAETCMKLPAPDWPGALTQLENVLEADKTNGAAYVLLCTYHEKRGLRDELKKVVRRAHELKVSEPKIVKLYQRFFVDEPKEARKKVGETLAKAKKAFTERDFDKAGDLYDKARELSPSIEIAELAADANALSERYTKTKKSTDELIELVEASTKAKTHPSWPAKKEYLEGRAKLLLYLKSKDKGTLASATLALARSTTLTTKKKKKDERLYCWAKTYHGMALSYVGKDGAQLAELEKVYKPTVRYNDPELMYLQGKAYMRFGARVKKDKSVGEKAYKYAKSRFLNLMKISKVTDLLKAKAEVRLGRCDLALAMFDDNNPDDLRKSQRHFRDAKKLGLDNAELNEYLAQTYVLADDPIRAAAYYSDAYDRAPTEARLLRAIEYYLKASPRNARARELIKQGRETYPNSAELKKLELEVGTR